MHEKSIKSSIKSCIVKNQSVGTFTYIAGCFLKNKNYSNLKNINLA